MTWSWRWRFLVLLTMIGMPASAAGPTSPGLVLSGTTVISSWERYGFVVKHLSDGNSYEATFINMDSCSVYKGAFSHKGIIPGGQHEWVDGKGQLLFTPTAGRPGEGFHVFKKEGEQVGWPATAAQCSQSEQKILETKTELAGKIAELTGEKDKVSQLTAKKTELEQAKENLVKTIAGKEKTIEDLREKVKQLEKEVADWKKKAAPAPTPAPTPPKPPKKK